MSFASGSCILYINNISLFVTIKLCIYQFKEFFLHTGPYTSGYTLQHHLNFTLLTELQHFQNNSTAKQTHKHVFFFFFFLLHFQCLFVVGQAPVGGYLTLTTSQSLVAPVTRGCPLTTANTVLTDLKQTKNCHDSHYSILDQ